MGPATAFLLLLLQPIDTDPLVRKGTLYLKSRAPDLQKDPEFALWTLVTADVDRTDPVVRDLLQGVLARSPETTRSAALQALALSRLKFEDRRERMAHCAQFLVDTQCADGRWDAGRPVDPPKLPPRPPAPPRIRENIPIVRSREGAQEGDEEHSRWAAWGLLACHQDGFTFPAELPQKAAAAWRAGEHDPVDVVACLSTHLYFQKKDWKKDPDVVRALDRLAVRERAGDPRSMFLLKRAMFLYNSATLGGEDWWTPGVRIVAGAQNPDGGWDGVERTCWAVLYLHVVRIRWPEPRPR